MLLLGPGRQANSSPLPCGPSLAMESLTLNTSTRPGDYTNKPFHSAGRKTGPQRPCEVPEVSASEWQHSGSKLVLWLRSQNSVQFQVLLWRLGLFPFRVPWVQGWGSMSPCKQLWPYWRLKQIPRPNSCLGCGTFILLPFLLASFPLHELEKNSETVFTEIMGRNVLWAARLWGQLGDSKAPAAVT